MARALIVIDLQNDYFPAGFLPLNDAEAVEKRVVAAIEHSRQVGDRIILIRHISRADSGLFGTGSPGIDLRPAITEAAGDAPIVTKAVADAFQDTDLAEHLDGISKLLICGMMTQNCVVFTAMSQAAGPFDVTVISDLCTAPSEVVHKIALNALGSKLRVANAADIWT